MGFFKRKGQKNKQQKNAAADPGPSVAVAPELPTSGAEVATRNTVELVANAKDQKMQPAAPFRTSFFQSANNVGVTGGQFNSTRGHHTNLTINFNQGGIEPIQEFQPEDDRSPQPINQEQSIGILGLNGLGIEMSKQVEEIETDRVLLKPATPPIQKSSDIYYRHLSVKELGYPLWIPEPNNRLPIKYQRRGVQIGDVGIITHSGSFDFLFNICLPPDDPINPRELPEHFAPLHPPLDPADTRGLLEFKPNNYLASSSIERSQREDGGDIANLTFESSASEGAILTMPDGAYSEDLANVAKFRKYLAANAESWYRYVNGARGREALNGDVRLVIGCHKTTAWGMATFADLRERKEFRLRFRPTGEDSRVGRTYGWEYSGMAEVRAGPDPQETEDLRMAEESEAGVKYRNQCLFIRTLNVTLRDDIWKQLLSELDLGFDLENSHPEDFDASRSQSPSSPGNTSLSKGKGPAFQPHTANSLATNTFKDDVHIPGLKRVLTPHPSKAINDMLLAEFPKARMAITEDWDWMSVLRDDDTLLPLPEQFCTRVRASHLIVHDSDEGVVSLQTKTLGSKFFDDIETVVSDSRSTTIVNPSPSNRSVTLSASGTTLDSGGEETDEKGHDALRSIGMNRTQSPHTFNRPLPLPLPRNLPRNVKVLSGIPWELEEESKTRTTRTTPASRTDALGFSVPRPVKDQTPDPSSPARRPSRKVLLRKSKLQKMDKSTMSAGSKDMSTRDAPGIISMDDGMDDGDFSLPHPIARRDWAQDSDENVATPGVGRRALLRIASFIRQ